MKVHSESYLSELFSMRNYPEESNVGSWSLLYEDRLPKNGRCYNGLTQMPLVGNADFGTDILRQTMLRHEHIFRKQVPVICSVIQISSATYCYYLYCYYFHACVFMMYDKEPVADCGLISAEYEFLCCLCHLSM